MDFLVRNIVRDWVDESFVRAAGVIVRYEKDNDFQTLTIYTDSPEALVGQNGYLIEKYKARILATAAHSHIEEIAIVGLNDMIVAR